MTSNQQDSLPALTTSTAQATANELDISHWQPIAKFLDENSQFNLGQIRWLIRNKGNNGFAACIKKVGRQYYINDQLFAKWISNQE